MPNADDIYYSILKYTCDLLPDTIPTADPIVACANVMGEEMNKAIMNIPPVQALSHP